MFMLFGIHNALLFKEDDKEINLVPHEAITEKALSFLGVVAPSLLPSKLELEERTMIYNPQRVMRLAKAWSS